MKRTHRFFAEDTYNFSAINRLFGMFTEENTLNEKHLFLCRFNKIPNWICLHEVNCSKAKEWLLVNYQHEVEDQYFVKSDCQKGRRTDIQLADCYYFLFDDLLVYFKIYDNNCYLLFRDTDPA